MDGSDQKMFVESKVLWPTSLAIDFPARRLYWSDLKLRTVSTVLLDGARLRKEIRKLHPKEGKPFKIEVFESHIYLTTFQYNRVFKVDKFGRGGMTKVVEEVSRINDIAIIQENLKKRDIADP